MLNRPCLVCLLSKCTCIGPGHPAPPKEERVPKYKLRQQTSRERRMPNYADDSQRRY